MRFVNNINLIKETFKRKAVMVKKSLKYFPFSAKTTWYCCMECIDKAYWEIYIYLRAIQVTQCSFKLKEDRLLLLNKHND
jgi:hypothetical protein